MADLNLTITLTASDALLQVLGRIADGLACAAVAPPAPADPSLAQTEPPGVPAAHHPSVPFAGAAEGPSRAAASTSPPAPPRLSGAGGGSSVPVPKDVWLTPERRRALLALYATEPVFQTVWEQVKQASPGVPMCAKRNDLRNAAIALGLRRPPNAITPAMKAALAARHESPAENTEHRSEVSLNAPALPASTASPEAAPPEDRLEAMLLSAARPRWKPAAPTQPPSKAAQPIAATQNQIRTECDKRGYMVGNQFDLDAINRKFLSVGHPGFVLKEAPRPQRSA